MNKTEIRKTLRKELRNLKNKLGDNYLAHEGPLAGIVFTDKATGEQVEYTLYNDGFAMLAIQEDGIAIERLEF